MEYLKYSVEKLMEVNANANVEECNFKDDLTECNITLKTLRSDNVNKLTFAHLNISSIRNIRFIEMKPTPIYFLYF